MLTISIQLLFSCKMKYLNLSIEFVVISGIHTSHQNNCSKIFNLVHTYNLDFMQLVWQDTWHKDDICKAKKSSSYLLVFAKSLNI